jgi:hypothetical protein
MADNLDVKDAAAATKTLRTKDLGSQHLPYHAMMDSSGAEMLGEKVTASSMPVALPTNQALLGRGIANPSDSFQRPATNPTYASGQLVANHGTAASVVALSFGSSARFSTGGGIVLKARLQKSTTGLSGAAFRLHIYSAAPTGVANGDTGAWSTNIANYLDSIDVTIDKAFVDGAYGVGAAVSPGIAFKLASGSSLKGLLEARGSYTSPNSEVFTATLEIQQT